MTERACSRCVKVHPAAGGRLECRAKSPVADDHGSFARWPLVRLDDFCHDDFSAVPAAAPLRARRAPAAHHVEDGEPGAELPL